MNDLEAVRRGGEFIVETLLPKQPLIVVEIDHAQRFALFQQYLYYYLAALPSFKLLQLDMQEDPRGVRGPYTPWIKALGVDPGQEELTAILACLQDIKSKGKHPVFVIKAISPWEDFSTFQAWQTLLQHPAASRPLFSLVQIMPAGYLPPVMQDDSQDATYKVIDTPGQDDANRACRMVIAHGFRDPVTIRRLLQERTLRQWLTPARPVEQAFKTLDRILRAAMFFSLYLGPSEISDRLAQLREELNLGEIEETLRGLQLLTVNTGSHDQQAPGTDRPPME